MSDSSSYNPLIAQLSKKLGSDPAQIQNAVKNGSPEDILKSMNAKDAARVRSVLGNKDELQRLMNSDAFQSLKKKLSEGH